MASTEILPELGRDGVYHITNPEQHKYVLFWKFKLPLLFPISSTFNFPPLFFPSHRALIEANLDNIMWGTDWRHPNKYEVNPNDGDLVDAFGEWVTDDTMRQKIMVTNPEKFYSF